MPVTFYQSADAAARNNKLEQHVPDTYGTSVIVSIRTCSTVRRLRHSRYRLESGPREKSNLRIP